MDFAEYRHRLEQRRQELTGRASQIDEHLQRVEGPLEADFAEQAVTRESDEVYEALGAAARAELRAIDAALRRLDNGSYGRCISCGAAIEPGRLSAVPEAERCVQCARWDPRSLHQR